MKMQNDTAKPLAKCGPTGLQQNSAALHVARDAHDNYFSSRRGTGSWADSRGKVIGFYAYDNNPLGLPDARRERLYGELAAGLEERGCRLVGQASYPVIGDAAGYTLAMIFVSASPARVDDDYAASRRHLETLLEKMYAEIHGE